MSEVFDPALFRPTKEDLSTPETDEAKPEGTESSSTHQAEPDTRKPAGRKETI